jgi:hypothetical protein
MELLDRLAREICWLGFLFPRSIGKTKARYWRLPAGASWLRDAGQTEHLIRCALCGIADTHARSGHRGQRLLDPVPGIAYPRVIEAAGRCPPEHIGGRWVYPESSRRSPIPTRNAMPNSRIL